MRSTTSDPGTDHSAEELIDMLAPRMLHPFAWWAWGVGLATAAAHTTNPLLLGLVVAVAAVVVSERREVGALDTFGPFLLLGLLAITVRVGLAVLLGNGVTGRTVLIELPRIALPDWFAGVRLGGPVTLESAVAAGLDGMRLAATLACLGAANALASPRRLLRHAPATLYDIGTALVVALTFAPQLVDLARRTRAARRLRGHSGRGLRELARLSVPVLEGALERSLELAASMESRGYGRTPVRSKRARAMGSLAALVGAAGIIAGLVGVLGPASGGWLGLPMLAVGVSLTLGALLAGGRADTRTALRRDPWSGPESLTLGLGLLPALVLLIGEARGWPGVLMPQVPLAWPPVPLAALGAIAAAAVAAVLTPVPPRLAAARRADRPPAPETVLVEPS
jgi:energy-coupling factor transport system permease protein